MYPWEENVRRVTPYVPGEQPKIVNMIKLNTNENPYPPSPQVFKAAEGFDAGRLRLYPDPTASLLVDAIAAYEGVSPEQVFVGVGSDDVLAMAFLTFFNSKKPILFPDITYSFYDVWADLYRIPFEVCPLDEDFAICADDYKRPNGGIVFPNPNAPTGAACSLELIREVLDHNPDVVVIIDEAYVDFGAQTALPLIREYPNLLVVRTMSKSRSMAGIRIGYAFGDPALIKCLNDVKFSFNSYTINLPALLMGVAAIEDDAYFQKTRSQIIKTREHAKKRLSALGFSFPDSKSNFLFVTHAHLPARKLFAALRAQGIIVRYFDKPRIDNYLRITIGTDEQMEALYTFLEEYLR